MTAAVNLFDQFALPQESNGWLGALRQRHWNTFLRGGLPQPRQERWKYADLSWVSQLAFKPAICEETRPLVEIIQGNRIKHSDSILLVSVNGVFDASLSDLHHLPAGVIACSIDDALRQYEGLIKNYWADEQANLFACLNAALFAGGLFFYVPDEVELPVPVHCLSLAAGEYSFSAHPRRLIVLGRRGRLTLLDEHIAMCDSPYLVNHATQFVLEESAALKHYKIQREQAEATHLASTVVRQSKDSQYLATYFSSGSRFARDEVSVKLNAAGAVCNTGGFYHPARDGQYVDYHIDVEHAAPRSQSDMIFKGVLDNRSRAVFNGRLQVVEGAQKITAHQANHNILLSAQAEVYSKPELEIYADDVKCKHGATIGQIDPEALFYLRSRGISEKEAIMMLLKGFSDEILLRIEPACLRGHIEERMNCL